MKKLLNTLVVSVAVLSAAAFATAQGPGGNHPGNEQHKGGGRMMEQMAQKLNLSAAQKTKLEAIQKKYQAKFMAMRNENKGSNDRQAMMAKFRPLMESFHKEVRSILNAKQQKMFDQMMAEQRARMQQRMKQGGHEGGNGK